MKNAKFVERKDHQDSIAEIVTLLVSRGRGATVQWEEIESIAGGYRYLSDPAYRIRQALGRLLRDHEIAYRAVRGVGVELLTDREQLSHCMENRSRRIGRQAFRGVKEVSGASDDRLSLHEQKAKTVSIAALRRLRSESRAGIKEAFYAPPSNLQPKPN